MGTQPLTNKTFDHFLTQQDDGIDWSSIKDDWLLALNDLYQQIEVWLSEYLEQDRVRLSYSKIDIEEENLGSYSAPSLIMEYLEQKIVFQPITALPFGAHGRVDIKSSKNTQPILLMDVEGPEIPIRLAFGIQSDISSQKSHSSTDKWVWKILDPQKTKTDYPNLDEDVFFNLLIDLINETPAEAKPSHSRIFTTNIFPKKGH